MSWDHGTRPTRVVDEPTDPDPLPTVRTKDRVRGLHTGGEVQDPGQGHEVHVPVVMGPG